MRTISLQELMSSNEISNICNILEGGGIVCLPCRSSYRIVAVLTNPKAVNALQHSKHRTSKAPSLVFIHEYRALKQLVRHIPPQAKILAEQLWPGELTIRFEPHPENLPPQVVKSLTKANGKLGVRIPSEPWIQRILEQLQKPLLVSSANRERKVGSSSPAMIRKNFVSHVDVFIDAGDIPATEPSTVIDFKGDTAVVKRPGSIAESRIASILERAAS
ncbi:MAG: L-threonylcarbamoyladenylate synthase [Bradymonadales bacterium]|jgi:L-threonylcarbamoyladenylate synthase